MYDDACCGVARSLLAHVDGLPSDSKLESFMKPSKNRPSPETAPHLDNQPLATKTSGVQGEGNYAAAREFNRAEQRFVASGKVAAAAVAAAPKSVAEQREMTEAEEAGKRRAKK